MHQQDKLVAAICLAPVILANAGVLAGERATVAGTQAMAIEAGGATYTGPGVTTDGNVVTANGPKSARLFGQKINEVLASQHPTPVQDYLDRTAVRLQQDATIDRLTARALGLQLQMESQCVIQLRHDVRRDMSEDPAQPLDGDRADLLGLGLGVLR